MDWKLFAQLTVTALVALVGGWLGHWFAARRDVLNERRKLRVTYLLEAYRRLEDAAERSDESRSFPKLESAIADIQLLGSATQVDLSRQFAQEMARNRTASLNPLLGDLRRSLRDELDLAGVAEPIVFFRISSQGPETFSETFSVAVRNVAEAKAEIASRVRPADRERLEQASGLSESESAVASAWNELESLVRHRLHLVGQNSPSASGAAALLDLALRLGALTDVQHRALRGLHAMQNLIVHRKHKIEIGRIEEFLSLYAAMKTVLEIAEPPTVLSIAPGR